MLLRSTPLFLTIGACLLASACDSPETPATPGSLDTGTEASAGTPDEDAQTTATPDADAETDAGPDADASVPCEGSAPGCFECLYDGPVGEAVCANGEWSCDVGELNPECTPDDYFDCSEFGGEVCCDIDGNATSAKCPTPSTPFCPDGSEPVLECNSCGATPDTGAPPESIASTQSVSFRVTNDTGEVRYIALAGADCEGWGIAGVPAQVNFQCGCECPMPSYDFVTQWLALEPGAEHVLTWDARGLATYDVPHNCCEQGWGPDAGIAYTTSAARQPVEPGSYAVFVGVATTLPDGTNCLDVGDGTFDCYGPDFADGGDFPPNLSAACSDLSTVNTTFALPAAGDVEVPIALGSAAP